MKERGLDVDERGGVCMSDILAQHEFRNRVCLDDLKRVVSRDRKARFTIYYDAYGRLRIKANQGHGRTVGANIDDMVALREIKTALELNRKGYVCCHGTYRQNWHDIKRNGLKRFNRKHIHFATLSPEHGETISGVRATCEILIFLDVRKFLKDGGKLYLSLNNVLLTPGFDGVVPPQYFRSAQQIWPAKVELWPEPVFFTQTDATSHEPLRPRAHLNASGTPARADTQLTDPPASPLRPLPPSAPPAARLPERKQIPETVAGPSGHVFPKRLARSWDLERPRPPSAAPPAALLERKRGLEGPRPPSSPPPAALLKRRLVLERPRPPSELRGKVRSVQMRHDRTMQFKERIAKVHGGSLRWRGPDAAANGGEEALVQCIMRHKVATSEILTSLENDFWSLLSSDTDAAKAGVAFAKAMNQLSQIARLMVDAMTTQDTRSRREADSNLRSSLGKLITKISESQKIMRNGSYR